MYKLRRIRRKVIFPAAAMLLADTLSLHIPSLLRPPYSLSPPSFRISFPRSCLDPFQTIPAVGKNEKRERERESKERMANYS
jgi:hypothetical protein